MAGSFKFLAVVLGLPAFFVTFSAQALLVNAPVPISGRVTVQPIIISDDDGSNTAGFFGNATQQASIEGFIDSIWAQAGIDIEFLTPNTHNSSPMNGTGLGVGGSARDADDFPPLLQEGANAGVTNTDPNVPNMFLVNVVPGLPDLGPLGVGGRARVGGNGIAQFVGASLLNSENNRELVASVVAHEIGHNLGLNHLVEGGNLMQASGAASQGERLNLAQIQNALGSPFVVPVPLPAAGGLLVIAVGFLGAAKLRRFGV